MLTTGSFFRTVNSSQQGKVIRFIGGGGQGNVYEADLGGRVVALKWFHQAWLDQDRSQKTRLVRALERGSPDKRFLWPTDLAESPFQAEFGYVMPLRDKRFSGIVDLMQRRVEPTFHVLATAGFNLAESYLKLHHEGLCYKDINFQNVFVDAKTGEIQICDNDNVDIQGHECSIGGTPKFMAPEIVRGEASPSIETDLYSLSVLLFYMLCVAHPLEGKRESAIHCMDPAAQKLIYGKRPLFVFDPTDSSNEPDPRFHENALLYWTIYPKFLRDLFTQAFTRGLTDPEHGRVRESVWSDAMVQLRDSIMSCPNKGCGAENFFDPECLRTNTAHQFICWSCNVAIPTPARIKIGRSVVVLSEGKRIYDHHFGDHYNFEKPQAEVCTHPTQVQVLGLRNIGTKSWTATLPDTRKVEVPPGQTCKVGSGTRIDFGPVSAEIRMN